MDEKEIINKKLKTHIIYNIVGFMTIFIIFGVFIFYTVRNVIYSQNKNYLYDTKEKIINLDQEELKYLINPSVVIVVRDGDGNIINGNRLGRIVDYAESISFDKNNLDKIVEITIKDKYTYRPLSFEFEKDEIEYVQLLANIDGEKSLIDGFYYVIVSSVIVGCLLSINASYFLSKKTLSPLKENMLKQMEFVGNVSHELRTPLTIIQAKQELLLQDPNAKIIDKSEDISTTLNETKRLTKMVNDLLILSRADSHSYVVQKEKIKIDDYIKEIVLPYEELAEFQNKKIIENCDSGLELNIDSGKLYQLIIILIDNALKYTESGDEIEIGCHLKDNKCVIEVKDTGIGISEEGKKRVFERFYREDKARGRETGGSGLGLTIASTIVSICGGTISVSNNVPKGTVFTVKIPK